MYCIVNRDYRYVTMCALFFVTLLLLVIVYLFISLSLLNKHSHALTEFQLASLLVASSITTGQHPINYIHYSV